MVQKDDRSLTRGRSTRIHNFSLLGSLSLSQLYNSASTSKLHCPHKSPVPFPTRYGKFTVQQKKNPHIFLLSCFSASMKHFHEKVRQHRMLQDMFKSLKFFQFTFFQRLELLYYGAERIRGAFYVSVYSLNYKM